MLANIQSFLDSRNFPARNGLHNLGMGTVLWVRDWVVVVGTGLSGETYF